MLEPGLGLHLEHGGLRLQRHEPCRQGAVRLHQVRAALLHDHAASRTSRTSRSARASSRPASSSPTCWSATTTTCRRRCGRRSRRRCIILADRVETVTPFLAEGVLTADKSGARVEWLTKGKAARRFATASVQQARPVRTRARLLTMTDACRGLQLLARREDVVPIVAVRRVGFCCLAQRIRVAVPRAPLRGRRSPQRSSSSARVRRLDPQGVPRRRTPTHATRWTGCRSRSSRRCRSAFAILCWAVLCLLRDRKRSRPWWPFAASPRLFAQRRVVGERSIILIAAGGLFAVATGVGVRRAGQAAGRASPTACCSSCTRSVSLGSTGPRLERGSCRRGAPVARAGHQHGGAGTFRPGLPTASCASIQRAGDRSVLVEN